MDTNTRADGAPGHLITSFVSLVTGSFVVRLLAFVASVFVIRAVGPSDFGTFAFGLTLAMVFALCVNFGVDDWLVREIARAPEDTDELVGHATLLRLAAVPIGLVGALSLGLASHTSWMLTISFAAYGVLHSYVLLVCAVFRGRGRQRIQAILLSTQMALIAAASIAASWLTGSIVFVAAGYAGASAVTLAIGYTLLLRERVRPRYQWRPDVWAYLLRTGLPFWLTLQGLLALDRLAIVSVAVLCDATTLGWFSVAYNLVLALTTVPMAAVAAVFPLLARTAERSPAMLERMVSDLIRYSTMLSLAVAASLYILAPLLIPTLFGASYEASVPALRLLTLSIPALFLTILLINVLEAADRQKSCATGMFQVLVVAAPLCFVATQHWGLEGASLAYVVTHFVLAVSQVERTSQVVGWAGIRRGLLRPALAGIGLWLMVITGHDWPPLVLLVLANLGFVVLLISLGAIGQREVHALRAVLPARPERPMADMTVQVLESIEQIAPAEWDELGGPRVFADHRWLRFTEDILIGHRPRYLVVRRGERLEAAAVCSVEQRFENRALQRRAGWLLRRVPCVRCAVPVSYQPGILTRPDADEARLIPTVLGAVGQLALHERALFTTVGHLAPDTATWSALRAAGCRPLSRWWSTTLPISWSSFDEYLASQPKSHRRAIARTRRGAERDGIAVRHRPWAVKDAPVLWQLIQNVMQRHSAPEIYAADLLPRAAAIFGDDLHLLVAEQSGEDVGCVVMVRSQNDLLAKWIGLDYRRTWDTDTYRLLLAETVALAIELGVERLWLGATALETKRQFGVTVEERLNAVLVPSPLRWLVDATGVA